MRDQQVIRYEVEALSVALMMKWAEDVFDLIQEHQHRVAVNLLYNVSAPKVSMSYLVLTNRDMLAPGVVPVAYSPDGVVEAIEMPDKYFVVAVQWHPEDLVGDDPCMRQLFTGLVEAARERMA